MEGDDAGQHEEEEQSMIGERDRTLEDAVEREAQTGRTIVRLLEPGEEGIRIPRGLDIDMFWKTIEECCQRADEVNAQRTGDTA